MNVTIKISGLTIDKNYIVYRYNNVSNWPEDSNFGNSAYVKS